MTEEKTKFWFIVHNEANLTAVETVCAVLNNARIEHRVCNPEKLSDIKGIKEEFDILALSVGVILIFTQAAIESKGVQKLINFAVDHRKILVYISDENVSYRELGPSLRLIDLPSLPLRSITEKRVCDKLISALNQAEKRVGRMTDTSPSQLVDSGNHVTIEKCRPQETDKIDTCDYAMVVNDPVRSSKSLGNDPATIIGNSGPLLQISKRTEVKQDNVQFTVALPSAAGRGESIILDVWAHLSRHRVEILRRIDQSKVENADHPVIRTQGPFRVERNKQLCIRVKFDGLDVPEPENYILWDGEVVSSSFIIRIPGATSLGLITGMVNIYCDGALLIARIPVQFAIRVDVQANKSVPFTAVPLRKAFVSYASEDRSDVLGRIQGMQKILPDLEVFLDVLALRSGDYWEKKLWEVIPTNDIFYLFWSHHAKASSWVEKEWRCALQIKGLDFISPVPLEAPEEVPPPEELSRKHFNDWTLAYRTYIMLHH